MSLILETCSVKEMCDSLGVGEKLLTELADRLEEWLKLQPHLPQDASRQRLEILILNSKMSLERAKKKLDMYYTMRGIVPEFYGKRDPLCSTITAVHDAMNLAILPKLTPEKYRTTIVQIVEPDASKYHPWDTMKYTMMTVDIRMWEDRCLGDIIIFDLSAMSLSHVMKMTPAYIKKSEIVAVQGYAIRVKGIHFTNASPVVNRFVNIVKSVMSPKLSSRIHIHPTGNLEALYEYVPKSILPKDYGGEYSSMSELSALLRGKVEASKDWFLEQEKVLVDERLRPGPVFDADSLFGFSGSFRKLDVD